MSDPFTASVLVRFRDLDPMGHVNHAVYASYLESARIEYIRTVLDVAQEELSFVIANLEITYKHPITLDDEPVVELTVTDLGESSCTMAYEIRTDDGVAATAETVLVHVDADAGEPAPFPDDVVARIEAHEDVATPA